MKFEEKYFAKFNFTQEQIKKNLDNALRDLKIAKDVDIAEVKFNYAYTALIKAGVALISHYNRKIKSVPGHHIIIIEKLAEILSDNGVNDMGNLMRSKRNIDFYGGGVEITDKEYREYIEFVENVIIKIKKLFEGYGY